MFPNLKSKKFIDISNNNTVTVIDQFENIAILDNSQRIDVKRLLDTNFFDNFIDPKTFFNENNYQIFTEKIKSIPNEAIVSMKDNDSMVIEYDPEEEKRILQEKAKSMFSNTNSSTQNQLDKFKGIVDEDELPRLPSTSVSIVDDPVKEVNRPIQVPKTQPQNQVQPTKEDPMITMFKNIKRNTEFKISIDIINKIPRPDFIEMMEDSYEVSIIEFLSKEFTKSIINDPSIIENKIKEEINNLVYKKNETKKVRKIPNVPVDSLQKTQEGVETKRKKSTPKDKVSKTSPVPKNLEEK